MGRDDLIGMREILKSLGYKMNFVKVCIALEILADGGLIHLERHGDCFENLCISLNFVRGKTDLERVPACIRIKSQIEK